MCENLSVLISMHRHFRISLLLSILVLISLSAASQTSDAATANQVKQEFLHAWNSYKQYAWGHDELKPLSKSYRDWYGVSFWMTPVDALDTMILMGMDDEAQKTRESIVQNLSFDKDIEVKNFEI